MGRIADIRMRQRIIVVATPAGIAVRDRIVAAKEGHASLKGLKLIRRLALPRLRRYESKRLGDSPDKHACRDCLIWIVQSSPSPRSSTIDYLLSFRHSGGRAKARFLENFGFRAQDWRVLRDAIIAHATANDVTASHQTRFGTRYEIDGPLTAPDGRTPIVRVVWFVESQESIPRLVTLVPRRTVVP